MMDTLIMTILAVTDLERSKRFYQEVFNWPVRIDVPVLVEFELPDGRGFAIYQRESFAINTNQEPAKLPPGAIAGCEFYFHCDDLPVTMARLEKSGARMLSELQPRAWGDIAAYYADPDGNVIAVAKPMGERK